MSREEGFIPREFKYVEHTTVKVARKKKKTPGLIMSGLVMMKKRKSFVYFDRDYKRSVVQVWIGILSIWRIKLHFSMCLWYSSRKWRFSESFFCFLPRKTDIEK